MGIYSAYNKETKVATRLIQRLDERTYYENRIDRVDIYEINQHLKNPRVDEGVKKQLRDFIPFDPVVV